MHEEWEEERDRELQVSNWVLGVSLFFFISFFLAPALVAQGTITDLEGRANAIDFASEDGRYGYGNQHGDENRTFVWTELNFYSAFIYAFGDFNCHNKAERSWDINGNQMPVCTRDLGIFLGVAIGGTVFRQRGIIVGLSRILYYPYSKNLSWIKCTQKAGVTTYFLVVLY